MDQLKETGIVDPDYESYNSALELNEEEDKKENLNKIKTIIEEQYNQEIKQRQEQIEQIELQICKVRKVLHLLRYTLIMSYYNKKELEYCGYEDKASTSDGFLAPDKQNRLHPALKKLLGTNINNFEQVVTGRDKRKSHARKSLNLSTTDDKNVETVSSPEIKRIKLDSKIVESETPSCNKNQQNGNCVEDIISNRKKIKYRIVIGNVSKWMPRSEDDMLTHKWMVYVRGPREKPDVSHFIDKVVFYLHPSYKPHDVVQVTESPFHLTRRGWGEFPVRVQIFFKVTFNKPIHVIHNLKLDKTYTGRQTLGNETLVDVFLYEKTESHTVVPEFCNDFPIDEIREEDLIDDDHPPLANSLEHDYCTDHPAEKPTPYPYLDHTYSVPDGTKLKIKQEPVQQDGSNALVHGLGHGFLDEPNMETVETAKQINKVLMSTSDLNNLLKLNRKDIKFNNTQIIVYGKNLDGNFLRNFNCEINNNFKISFPKNRFKNMGEALPFLFKRLPLYTEFATFTEYKRLYPFTASSLKEFVTWNVGKRRSAEWTRARIIRKMLITENIKGTENWNTKAILMYGRSHDYSPFVSYGLFHRNSVEKRLLTDCYSDSSQLIKNDYSKLVDDIPVNVDSDIDTNEQTSKNKTPSINITDSKTYLECCYIRQAALECGIILKPEEIDEGVKINGAEIMILSAIKCLAENIIRRARNHKVCTKRLSSSISTITQEDVEVAMNERPEIVSILEFRNRNLEEYYS